MSATINIIPDTRRMKMKIDKYPVKLRVIVKRVGKSYQAIYELSRDDYAKLTT